jgi:cation transport regulator
MPFNIEDVPENIRHELPRHALEIFAAAFNSAFKEYEDPSKRRGDESREEAAYSVAWAAVKKMYEKGPDGKWRVKKKT